MTKRAIDIRTADGVCTAGLFKPAKPGKAGIIIYMDAFGPRPALDQMAERLAGEGYFGCRTSSTVTGPMARSMRRRPLPMRRPGSRSAA